MYNNNYTFIQNKINHIYCKTGTTYKIRLSFLKELQNNIKCR